MSGHTPTPWVRSNLTEWCIVGDGGERLVASTAGHQSNVFPDQVESENRANGDLILRAVNSHEELLAALKSILPLLMLRQDIERVVDAIQRAEETAP